MYIKQCYAYNSYNRGQSYDGAGNMAGSIRGAAAIVRASYPFALYTHCASHRLNLCVMKACSIQVRYYSYNLLVGSALLFL